MRFDPVAAGLLRTARCTEPSSRLVARLAYERKGAQNWHTGSSGPGSRHDAGLLGRRDECRPGPGTRSVPSARTAGCARRCDRPKHPGSHFADRCSSIRLCAIRSIFSTCNASCKEVFRHYPMFRHRSATPAGVTGNGGVRSPGDNVASIKRIGRGSASRHGDCQHRGGRGPAVRVRSTQVKC